MSLLAYYAMTDLQISKLFNTLEQFSFESTKQKQLLEVQYQFHDLPIFERPSDSRIYCLRNKDIVHLKDIERAKIAIGRSFKGKIVQFL